MKIYLLLFISLLFVGCKTKNNVNASTFIGDSYNTFIKIDTLNLLDKSRDRKIPIAIYSPKKLIKNQKQKLVIFNPGYGKNDIKDGYLSYPYLTKSLAAKGYFVVSIQHELPTDELLPLTGNPQKLRRPFWDRGADNILFVINQLKILYPSLDFSHIGLIGHSNGGDMVALFPQKYPNIVDKIIALDNRRMPLPRTSIPKIYSIRASEFTADEGVLPTIEEQKKYGIEIIYMDAKHSDMGGHIGTISQKKEIIKYVLSFLEDNKIKK